MRARDGKGESDSEGEGGGDSGVVGIAVGVLGADGDGIKRDSSRRVMVELSTCFRERKQQPECP